MTKYDVTFATKGGGNPLVPPLTVVTCACNFARFHSGKSSFEQGQDISLL